MRRFTALLINTILVAQEFKFEAKTQLVIVNVTVRGKGGAPVTGLKQPDFRILEDGKPVDIAVFEYQELSKDSLPAVEIPKPAALPKKPTVEEEAPKETPNFRDKRLLVLYFDFSSLPQTDQVRAKDAAAEFLAKQMTTSDLVSVYTFATSLKKAVDFTQDRDLLLRTIQSFGVADAVEMEAADAAEPSEDNEDTASIDETEFAIFNTDRKFAAIEDLAKELAPIQEKKAVVYFSSGVGKKGVENQSQMQSAVNMAVRSGVALYPIDVRGLMAMPPAGDATKSSPKGQGIFSGREQGRVREKANDSQETLFTLAADTGGKALLDSNDLALGIRQAQKDIDSYYTIAYYSTNTAKDGRFRKIKVELTTPNKDAKLDYRPGYYADKVWSQFDSADKEKQLSEAMSLGNPVTELDMAVELMYFRIEKGRYAVPLAVKIPGSQVGLKSGRTELDFIGAIRDAKGKTVATLRDSIKVRLPEGASEQLAKRSMLYDAGFQLAPGQYRIKVLARENQEGKLGTYESKFTIPDLDAGPSAGVSSLVLGTAREPLKAAIGKADGGREKPMKEPKPGKEPNPEKAMRKAGKAQKTTQQSVNPLVRNGGKLAPSVTHVFRRGQSLTAYGETYSDTAFARLAIYRGKERIWESGGLRPTAVREGAFGFETVVPLRQLRPGEYTCQLTVIDPVAQKFETRRQAMAIAP
ncbi:MAG: VWA domain-containing protein [Acidobacteria bacterium]|nr:VWA domain-containing protein [Acidobacteriota bacterium]